MEKEALKSILFNLLNDFHTGGVLTRYDGIYTVIKPTELFFIAEQLIKIAIAGYQHVRLTNNRITSYTEN